MASCFRLALRALAIAGLSLAGVMPAHGREPLSASPPAIEYVGEVQLSPRLREITLKTSTLAAANRGLIPGNPNGQTKVRVLLPTGYDAKGARRYPVLYLYHGGGGNQTEWTTPAAKGKAEELTANLPLIVVMPEGGLAGGYADWYNDGAYGPPQWKTYHLDQLVPWIDARFRTIAHRGGRATAGLSMGGGGLRYAEQRPDLIGATAAFSGDIDILQPASDWVGMGAPVSRMIWGDRKTQEVRWRGASGVDLAKNLVNTRVAIFTGDTGRPEGTYILQGSTAVHEALNRFGIAHRFTVYPGLTHSWPNWNKALAAWLPDLMGHFQKAGRSGGGAGPAAFSYSAIEPAYSLYGWTVEMHRAATEFSTLEVTGARSFSLIGSGRATVRTPPLGRANTAFRVTMSRPGQPGVARTIRLRTDAAGRLAVPVALGPANPFQQYSPEARAAATGPSVDETPFQLFDNGSRFHRIDVRIVGGR